MQVISELVVKKETPPLGVLPPLSEFEAKPKAFIVHDPAQSGGLEVLNSRGKDTTLEEEFLFRELPNGDTYARQHKEFVRALSECGGDILYLSNIVGDHSSYQITGFNPNQVFTRDSLMTLPWVPKGYISARMRPAMRRPEATTMAIAANRLGLREIVRLPEDLFLEGGDFIPFVREGRRTLLLGYGPRTMLESAHFLQKTLIPSYLDEIIAISLGNWRINLDGGLLPIASDVVVSNKKSILGALLFDGNGIHKFDLWEMFRSLGMDVIDTTREESMFYQSCNCICLGERKVIYYDLCSRVRSIIEDHDVEVFCIEGCELVKGRGGPRCMSRPVYC